MKANIKISGFADEIAKEFTTQLETVKSLGMKYICIRAVDGKSIADFTVEEAKTVLVPMLAQYGIGVSSIGSPIGKVDIEDEEGYQKQLGQLDTLCQIAKLLDCRYIRMFSFFIKEGKDPAAYRDAVMEKMKAFIAIAEKHDVVLLHENEKDIYGDIGSRCKDLLDNLGCAHLRAAFDFANFVQCGEDPEACWELMRPYIEYIHIKDADKETRRNVPCGQGDGKIPQLLARAINEEGYEGFLTMEPHLFMFLAMPNMERGDMSQRIRPNMAENGVKGFTMQYECLMNILNAL